MEISREQPFARAGRSRGGGECAAAASGRRGGRATAAASAAAGRSRKSRAWRCRGADARDHVRAAGLRRTETGRNSATGAHVRNGWRPRCVPRRGRRSRRRAPSAPSPARHRPAASAGAPVPAPGQWRGSRARWRHGRPPLRRRRLEHAVDDRAVDVQVRIERRAKAVDEGHRAHMRRGARNCAVRALAGRHRAQEQPQGPIAAPAALARRDR